MEIIQSIELWKVIFLFLAIWFTSINITRATNRVEIRPMNFIVQAIGLTGFIYLQWLI